jgi:hypothetical protein
MINFLAMDCRKGETRFRDAAARQEPGEKERTMIRTKPRQRKLGAEKAMQPVGYVAEQADSCRACQRRRW